MIVSNLTPPPVTIFAVNWERGLDPWHADAFKGTGAEGAFVDQGTRKSGWYEIDWCGNQIGFVADGAEIADSKEPT